MTTNMSEQSCAGAVEVIGCVVAVDVQRKTLQLRTDQGEEILVPFTEEDEADVITALKERDVVQLLVRGQGRFSPDGKLKGVQDVTGMLMVNKKTGRWIQMPPALKKKLWKYSATCRKRHGRVCRQLSLTGTIFTCTDTTSTRSENRFC